MNTKTKIAGHMLGLASLLMASQVNAATISLTLSASTINVDDLFSLTVQGSGFNNGVTAGGVILEWDTASIQLVGDINDINSSLGLNGFANSFGNNISVNGSGIASATIDGLSFSDNADAFGNFDFVTLDFLAASLPSTSTVDIFASISGDWQDAAVPLSNPVVVDQLNNVTVNIEAVPVPAAVWLFGSGLIGLVGVARRKQQLA
jgi:hypothetical protein